MSATQSTGASANLRPWKKGQSGNPGGLSKKVRKFRRDAEKRLPRALTVLDELLASEDRDDQKFALEWMRKAFLPTPKESGPTAPSSTGTGPAMTPAVRERLARLQ